MSDYSYFGGIDLAKNHFSIHVVNSQGKVILHKSVTRSKLLPTLANMPPMRIGLEACGGAHYWARTLHGLGMMLASWRLSMSSHTVQKVKMTSMMRLLFAKLYNIHLPASYP